MGLSLSILPAPVTLSMGITWYSEETQRDPEYVHIPTITREREVGNQSLFLAR